MREESECVVGKRVAVVGTSGSGKTTLARRIAQRLGYPHVELDALHWGPNWTEASSEVFYARVDAALRGEAWVVDGNYGRVRALIWSRADTLVWLDYALPIILWRVVWRTFRRIVTREELWGNNREDWRAAFGRDSIILWALQTYARRRREYAAWLSQPEYAHLQIVHLRSPRQAQRWLTSIAQRAVPLEG